MGACRGAETGGIPWPGTRAGRALGVDVSLAMATGARRGVGTGAGLVVKGAVRMAAIGFGRRLGADADWETGKDDNPPPSEAMLERAI